MIKVLIVDDSPVARAMLTHLINASGDMVVVGTATNGAEAVEAAERLLPDIITMDIMMPKMDGPAAIDAIMCRSPRPIVVVTGNTITEEVRATFQSLDSGALAILPRPHGMDSSEHEASVEQLLQTLRLMSEIKVVRRLKPKLRATVADPAAAPHTPTTPAVRQPLAPKTRVPRAVAIGASTGGPSALKLLLQGLPPDFPLPIFVVQHIAAGFVDGFVTWLGDSTPLPVTLARDGETPAAGVVYVAPDGVHLTIGRDERLALVRGAATEPVTLCPSVTRLFTSVASTYRSEAIGVLLTGMGRDGADGMALLKRAGAVTIAQDRETSVIYGMPGEAVALGVVDHILPPQRIADLLTAYTNALRAPGR